MTRADGRTPHQIRPVHFSLEYVSYPEGSVLVEFGQTRVLCNISVRESIPEWMEKQSVAGGWVTAEYAMLPRSTHTRTSREIHGRRARSQEIRRFIGRGLRAAVQLSELGPRTLIADCDVIQADGGTRTAALTGSYVAMRIAIEKLIQENNVARSVLMAPVAAISVGVVGGEILTDLTYEEDSQASIDANVVMNTAGDFIEVQAVAEDGAFNSSVLDEMLGLARDGIQELLKLQASALA